MNWFGWTAEFKPGPNRFNRTRHDHRDNTCNLYEMTQQLKYIIVLFIISCSSPRLVH